MAELDVLLLGQGALGLVNVPRGDIDNQMKTLLDALSVPDDNQVKDCPLPDSEREIFCLLQDDKLITRLSVETDTLLDPERKSQNETMIVVTVHIRASVGLTSNLGIAI